MNGDVLRNEFRTDWDRLESMSDEEIDYSDIPPLSDDFFARADLRIPAQQTQNWVELDPDVAGWFRKRSREYKKRINSVLREHMMAKMR